MAHTHVTPHTTHTCCSDLLLTSNSIMFKAFYAKTGSEHSGQGLALGFSGRAFQPESAGQSGATRSLGPRVHRGERGWSRAGPRAPGSQPRSLQWIRRKPQCRGKGWPASPSLIWPGCLRTWAGISTTPGSKPLLGRERRSWGLSVRYYFFR